MPRPPEARRRRGSRPLVGSVPQFPIKALDLSGWRHSARHETATRVGRLVYTHRGVYIGEVTFRARVGQDYGTLTMECSFRGEVREARSEVQIVSVPNPWGGRHWFFECPITRKRARILYRWPGIGFSHRAASPVPPVYSCQQDSGRQRAARSMHAIQSRLGGVPGHVEKPVGMPMRTYLRMSTRYLTLHDRFWGPTRAQMAYLSRPI